MRASPSRALIASVAALAAASCADPSLRIELDVPADYSADIDSAVLRILSPPALESFTCDDLAFGAVSEETWRASLVQEVVTAAAERLDLAEIPRLGDKLLWLEAMDQQGAVLVAGCAWTGDITGQDAVVVTGEPATVVSSTGAAVGEPLPERVDVRVTDTRGRPLSGVDVSWTVVGPGDIRIQGTATTAEGRAAIEPEPPGVAGPAWLDVHAPWEHTALAPMVGFYQPEVLLDGALPGAADNPGLIRTAALYTVGRLGPQGQMGFAALGPPAGPLGSEGRQVLVAYHDPGAGSPPFRVIESEAITGARAVGHVARDGRDIVLVATPTAWHEVLADGTTALHAAPGKITRLMVPAGPCDAGSELVLAAFTDDTVAAFDADGNQVASPLTDLPAPGRLLATGCVAGLDDQLYRAAVFNIDRGRHRLVANMDTLRQGDWVSYSPGVGFAPALDGQPARLLGMNIDIQGATVSRYQLAPLGGVMLEPQLVDEDPTLTFVRSLQGGDIDGDGRADVIALLDFGTIDDDQGLSDVRVQVILGTEYRGQRLVGVSPSLSALDPQLLLADFDGDGADDLLLAGRAAFTLLRGQAP